jgi:lysophospholipase L1-like esterase
MRARRAVRVAAATLFVATGIATSGPSPVAAQVSPTRPTLNVVVLGDSYSAGNGARNANGDRAYYGPSGCYRSDYSWNGLFVDALEATFDPVVSRVACSGGVLGDVTSRRDMDDVNIRPRFVGCPGAKWDEEWQRTDLNLIDAECRRFMKPQIDSVGSNTDLVMFTGGGNDAKFAKIVEQCFAIGLRDPGDCSDNVDFADTLITVELGGRLDTVFGALRSRLRTDAQVLYVGYPYLIDDVDYTLKTISPFSDGEYAAGDNVRRIGDAGDDAQRAAVARSNDQGTHRFTYVDGADVKTLFDGKAPNPDQSAPRNPNRWFHEFETRIAAEWYHFNPDGHQGLADFLAARYSPTAGGVQTSNDVDIVFVVDTTGSMGSVIGSVRNNLTAIVDNLAASTSSYRVGVVSYRDFRERTGSNTDYPARVDTPLTSDRAAITAAISSLTANGGGDFPESVLSGINAGLDLSWRAGVTKVMVVIGDAPPLGPPEPITGLTADDIVGRALEIDPVQIFAADTGALTTGAISEITTGTGGSVIAGSNIVTTIDSIVGTVASQPFAWIAGPYVGTVGEPYVLDSTGSFDPSGAPLSSYEWDVNGDGAWDVTTAEPTLPWTYIAPFSGVAVVRVTGPGGTALGSAWIDITTTGTAPMGDEEPCTTDSDANPVTSDADGRPLPCTATLQPDPPGVIVTSTESQPDYTVTALPPTAGRTQAKANSAVPIHFRLTDAEGAPIPDDVASGLLTGQCRVNVSVAGAQVLAPTCPTYDPTGDKFQVIWKTARQPKGQVTVTVTVTTVSRTTPTEIAVFKLV